MFVPSTAHANHWLDQVFSAKAVDKGGVVRRSTRWVEAQIGRDRFFDEVRKRGFHLVECGGQYVVICSQHPIHIHL